jgi:type II secretory pathway pseudopilin PulG
MNSPTSPPLRARTGDPMVRVSRGLTLLETLVALAIVVTLAVLVLPTLSWMSGFRSLDVAREDVEALYLRARAHAAMNGRPIQIHLSESTLEANWFEAEEMFSDDSQRAEDGPSFPLATWSRVRLLDEIDYQTKSDLVSTENNEGSFFPLAGSDEAISDEVDVAVTPVLLAIIFPDGTAISRERLVLKDERGRTTDIVIDELTGRITSTDNGSKSSETEERLSEPLVPVPDDPSGSEEKVAS